MRRIVTASMPQPQPVKRDRPDQVAYLRTRRMAAISDGRCFECCSRPVALGVDGATPLRRCKVCTDRQVSRRKVIVSGGGCYSLCGRPAEPGSVRCPECREKHKAYMAARRLAAGMKPRVPRDPGTPRPPRKRRTASSTSVVPSACPHPAPTDGPRMAESAPPAEVDLSTRRAVIAALVARRAA